MFFNFFLYISSLLYNLLTSDIEMHPFVLNYAEFLVISKWFGELLANFIFILGLD